MKNDSYEKVYRLYKEVQIAGGISENQVKPVLVIDDSVKTCYFFGLIENPYKVMRRNIFEMGKTLRAFEELKNENARLKAELAALKEKL